jgi:hypothetical protein
MGSSSAIQSHPAARRGVVRGAGGGGMRRRSKGNDRSAGVTGQLVDLSIVGQVCVAVVGAAEGDT